jgi:hypothetical protein
MSLRLSFVAAALLAPLTAQAREPSTVPVFTEQDLARVHPFRDQTGVASSPAVAPSEEPAPSPRRTGRATSTASDETYWRREALRHRARQATLARRIEDLKRQIESRRRDSAHSLREKKPSGSLEKQLAALEESKRAQDSAFEDRARRAGALPGWLREE